QQNVLEMMSQKAPGQGGGSVAPAAAISALRKFFNENDNSRMIDRDLLTLQNFQRLASFLNSFPGRKNVIWFSQAFPLVITGNFEPQLIDETGRTLDNPSFDPRLEDEAARTLDMLAAARVVLYPVDAGGADTPAIFSGETQMAATMHDPTSLMDNVNSAHFDQATQRNTNQATMKMIAHQTGGKAFVNSNGLSKIIGQVAGAGGDFYTISYTPSDTKMDGTYRRIDIKVKGGNYQLAYRRGYVARDGELPGSGQALRQNALQQLQEIGPVDPLLPFMDLGMPQSQQILIEARITPELPGAPQPQDPKNAATRYSVDFALGVKDLEIPARADGIHEGSIRLSMIAYDRYGGIVSRTDRIVQYHVPPGLWKVYQASGVQLHADIAVPKGNYWLRTGIFDQQSRRVGTMEVPLAAVQPAPPRSNAAH
ncbi:MAG TPA: VWA domain-containing protein, partial [Candidatus Saccharimonadales bacterium]|nr:VWA domain-containing protein [Candidatus Saccharimonadales bacterium]